MLAGARGPMYGNLTAALLVVAFLELVIDRLLGRLFLAPGCQSALGCAWLRAGPLLLNLTGMLTLLVGAGAIAGHLRRGELFPRGVRFTIAALSLVFLVLLAMSLAFGRMPERYRVHLETSFAFVVALLALSVVGSVSATARTRAGFLLFATPALFHVSALVSARAGWLRHGPVSPERLTSAGEVTLLLAAVTAPLLLLPPGLPRNRIAAGLALGAGIGAFFFVAFLGRTDLVQTMVLYGVHLELPRALSVLGIWYVMALFGFLTAAGVLLLSPGAPRLAGMGMCLVGIAGYQTSSPIALAISLCGLLALATGTLRSSARGAAGGGWQRLSPSAWLERLQSVAAGLGDAPPPGDPVTVETVIAGSADATDDAESDRATVRAARRGRPVTLELRRAKGVVRGLSLTVGTSPDAPPDATIESHEVWLRRTPDERPVASRTKTGDPAFDRRLGLYGRASLSERGLRRRLLHLADGTVTAWTGRAARFQAAVERDPLPWFASSSVAGTTRSLAAIADTLSDLVDAGA